MKIKLIIIIVIKRNHQFILVKVFLQIIQKEKRKENKLIEKAN